jgi:DinB superfamily
MEVFMTMQKTLPEHLVELLKGGQAHVEFDSAVKDWPTNLQGKTPKGAVHSGWEVLEHMRIAQWDILEFTRNPKHESPEFPSGYWPKTKTPLDKTSWNKSVDAFGADLKAMIAIVESESTDLYAPLPHGDGQTILREALVLADHNAYHTGELVLLRRLLGEK